MDGKSRRTMKMRLFLVHIVLFGCVVGTQGQFYPDSSAAWCLRDGLWQPNDFVQMVMSNDPDTLIQGQVYKRIEEYRWDNYSQGFDWDVYQRHYVRSDTSGKGYVFLVDSLAEYLTGDVAAIPGDTVRNVLVQNTIPDCPLWIVDMTDVVVDSVVQLTHLGVTVTRHYVHTPCYLNGNGSFNVNRFFWQAGMGTTGGPYLQIRSGLSPYSAGCVSVNGIVQMGGQHSWIYAYLPGGPDCCGPDASSVQENDRISSLSLSPNPAQNELRVELGRLGRGIPATLRIFDATGRQVHQEAMSNPVTRVDVSTLKGLLLVMVEQGGTRWMGKVVVQ
jgi:hypothetical protein